jgi:hypothetical protein
MAASMAFHLDGYEFLRSAGLTTFTSAFATTDSNRASIAFSLANVAVTPVSILCLWVYTRHIRRSGPRQTLRRSIAACILVIVLVACHDHLTLSPRLRQGSIAAAFVFQNTYVSLITSQQWSFLDSVVTPRQGTAWFGALTGLGSIAGTLTASLVPKLVPYGGVMGLYLGTAATLLGALICADRAYAIATQHHRSFDHAGVRDISSANGSVATSSNKNSIRQAWALVRRVPTLRALFAENVVYQIFSTTVNFATLRALQIAYAHDDARRSSLTGQFYAVVNGISAFGQFLILPFLMKYLEVKQIWRCIAILPVAATMLHTFVVYRFSNSPIESTYILSMLATVLFTSQVTDYSIRSVLCNVAYQPLDYESRYIGKEFIGVFGSRVGRSGIVAVPLGHDGDIRMKQSFRGGSSIHEPHALLFASDNLLTLDVQHVVAEPLCAYECSCSTNRRKLAQAIT